MIHAAVSVQSQHHNAAWKHTSAVEPASVEADSSPMPVFLLLFSYYIANHTKLIPIDINSLQRPIAVS